MQKCIKPCIYICKGSSISLVNIDYCTKQLLTIVVKIPVVSCTLRPRLSWHIYLVRCDKHVAGASNQCWQSCSCKCNKLVKITSVTLELSASACSSSYLFEQWTQDKYILCKHSCLWPSCNTGRYSDTEFQTESLVPPHSLIREQCPGECWLLYRLVESVRLDVGQRQAWGCQVQWDGGGCPHLFPILHCTTLCNLSPRFISIIANRKHLLPDTSCPNKCFLLWTLEISTDFFH